MANAGYTLVPPQPGRDFHTLIVHNTNNTQQGQSSQTSVPCFSYDKAIASLREIAGNRYNGKFYLPGSEVNLREQARLALDFLEHNPQSAEFFNDISARIPCGDLGQLIGSISSSVRDAVIAGQLSKYQSQLPNMTAQLESASKNLENSAKEFHATTKYASDSAERISTQWGNDLRYVSNLMAWVTLIAVVGYVAGGLIRRRHQ